MAEVANRSLSALESTSRLDKYRVLVHLDTERGWLNARPALPRHLLEKVTCDGGLQPVWETDGKPVSVGRSMRIVPRRSRRLVEDRDRGCRFPGCTAAGFVENHHINHWHDGGATDYHTLISLCPFHHERLPNRPPRCHAGERREAGHAMQPEQEYETDEERMDHHQEVNHQLQAVIDTVAREHSGEAKSAVMAALEQAFTSAGHWPQPKRWVEAIAEEIESGHIYRV